MAVSIREIRLDDVEAAIALVRQAGGVVERARVVTALSVTACEDTDASTGEAGGEGAAPAGVALCVREPGGGVVLHVAFSAEAPDPALVRDLVGKAMAKVRAAKIFACRVRMHNALPSADDPLSTGHNWYERFAREYAA